MHDHDRLLRTREVSQLTGFTESTLRTWRRDKKGPRSARLGGSVVYRESDVRAWIDSQLARTDSA